MAASISHVHTHMSTGVYTDAPLVCIHILHTYDMYIRCFGSTFQLKYVCVYTHIYIYMCASQKSDVSEWTSELRAAGCPPRGAKA